MTATTNVNNLTVVHRSSGGIASAFPDVCKTPAPSGAPIPIPYPNIARSDDTAAGSSTVSIDGNPIMLKSSFFAISTGDEAGSALGVISNRIKGKAYPKMYSFDVKVDGEPVFRLADIMCLNGGSPTNTPPTPEVQPPLACLPTNQDPSEPQVTNIRWDKSEIVCGDEVMLEVTIANLNSSAALQLAVLRESNPDVAQELYLLNVKDGPNPYTWLSRMGSPWEPARKLFAEQGLFKGVEKSGQLKFKTVPDAKELVQFTRTSPKYEEDTTTGAWLFKGDHYSWEVCYEIEIRAGTLTVHRKVDFRRPDGAAPNAVALFTWKEEIERVWNRKFKIHRTLCKRGDGCNCGPEGGCCVFPVHVRVHWMAGHGQQVNLYKGMNDATWGSRRWWFSHQWWEGIQSVAATVRAHEFGHLIGMFDEYPEGACEPLRQRIDGENIMGRGGSIEVHHLREFHAWFDKYAASVLGDTKLIPM